MKPGPASSRSLPTCEEGRKNHSSDTSKNNQSMCTESMPANSVQGSKSHSNHSRIEDPSSLLTPPCSSEELLARKRTFEGTVPHKELDRKLLPPIEGLNPCAGSRKPAGSSSIHVHISPTVIEARSPSKCPSALQSSGTGLKVGPESQNRRGNSRKASSPKARNARVEKESDQHVANLDVVKQHTGALDFKSERLSSDTAPEVPLSNRLPPSGKFHLKSSATRSDFESNCDPAEQVRKTGMSSKQPFMATRRRSKIPTRFASGEGRIEAGDFLNTRMPMSEWKQLRDHIDVTGSAEEKLCYKVFQEIILSPTLGIAEASLKPLSNAMGELPYYYDRDKAEIFLNAIDIPRLQDGLETSSSVLYRTGNQVPSVSAEGEAMSDSEKSMALFLDNVIYAFEGLV